MSVTFNKKTIAASAILALLVLASGASAAPSLGLAKGRPYYGSSNHRSGSGNRSARSYVPAFSTETRQSFSYEPGKSLAKSTGGCERHAVAPKAAKNDFSKQGVAAAPQVTRRSYSHEPAIQPAQRARSYSRSAAPKKDPWLYPKGEPRRYNH